LNERRAGRLRTGGFTLLELLVAVAISVGVLALLAAVFRQVLYTAEGLRAVESDWQLQQFMRRQLAARDTRFDAFELTEGDATSLRFVSRLSAANGMSGPPVYAQYHYAPNDQRLSYRERPLPPWWTADRTGTEYRNLVRAGAGGDVREWVLLEGLGDLNFAYREADGQGWGGEWPRDPDAIPPLVRLRFDRLGEGVEWLLPTAYMGYAMPAWQFAADDAKAR
jgi:prepilin-type N-terminal cleavage/methylation domain-containing protein